MEKTIGAVKISSFHCPEKGANSRRGIRKPVAFEGLYVAWSCFVWFCIVWLPYKPHYCRCKAALGQKSHWASTIVTAMGSFLTGIAFIANSAESSAATATAAQILLLTPAPPQALPPLLIHLSHLLPAWTSDQSDNFFPDAHSAHVLTL